jgi:hypothetical protein
MRAETYKTFKDVQEPSCTFIHKRQQVCTFDGKCKALCDSFLAPEIVRFATSVRIA